MLATELAFPFASVNLPPASRQALCGGGDLWGGEEHRLGVGARSALRCLTRRSCLSGAERSEFCGATPGRAPQRSRGVPQTATPGAPAAQRLPRSEARDDHERILKPLGSYKGAPCTSAG